MSVKAAEWLGNYTPLPDVIAAEHGVIAAAVFGNVWRYEQMRDGVCRASVPLQARRLRLDETTVRKWLAELVTNGYLSRIDKPGAPSAYRTTSKCQVESRMRFLSGEGVAKAESEPLPKLAGVPDEPLPKLGVHPSQNWQGTPPKTGRRRDIERQKETEGADAPRAPLATPKHTDPIEHAFSRKEKVEAEGRWRTLLRAATRPGSERACEIAIAFAELTRIEPATPAQAKSALAAAAEIVASGGTVDDMRAAWKVSQDPQKGFMVTDLHSLRGTVSAHVAKQKRTGPRQPKRIGWTENANGESVPVYEVAK